MIQESIVKLVQYGLATGLVEKEDKRYTTNKILELLQMDAIDEEYVKQIMESDEQIRVWQVNWKAFWEISVTMHMNMV